MFQVRQRVVGLEHRCLELIVDRVAALGAGALGAVAQLLEAVDAFDDVVGESEGCESAVCVEFVFGFWFLVFGFWFLVGEACNDSGFF